MSGLSSKSSVYIIDGSNFYMSVFSERYYGDRDAAEKLFSEWLVFVSDSDFFSVSEFMVFLDGGFRSLGISGANVKAVFSEPELADSRILEYASFCVYSGKRCFVISDDRELSEKAGELGAKTLSCLKFFRLAGSKIE